MLWYTVYHPITLNRQICTKNPMLTQKSQILHGYFLSVPIWREPGAISGSAAGRGTADHHQHLLWKSQSPVYQEAKTEHRICSAWRPTEMMRRVLCDHSMITAWSWLLLETLLWGNTLAQVSTEPTSVYKFYIKTVEMRRSNLWRRLDVGNISVQWTYTQVTRAFTP